jgi:hypothetical protein
MQRDEVPAPYDRFLVTAERVARARSDVDADLAREVFLEAATLLYDGLALDGLDDHDTERVVDGLCVDICAPDPSSAIRARSQATLDEPGDVHDAEAVSAAYVISAALFQL